MMTKAAVFFSLSLLLFPPTRAEQEEQTVKIAIASDGKTIDSPLSSKAARCKYFLIFDEEGQLTEVLDNPHGNVPGSAGPKAADFLAQKEVTLLVARTIGPKMIAALQTKEIAHLEFSGTVEEGLEYALKKLKE